MDRESVYQEVDSAGWEPDGNSSEQLVIGNKGDLCLIIPSWVEGRDDPVCELHDVENYHSYWVQQIPTPQKAAELLQEYAGPPEEERGNPYRTTKTCA
jgi:hypothetical protein